MVKMAATFRAFYPLRIWQRTNGGKWAGKWTERGKNMETGKWGKWDKWRANGRANGQKTCFGIDLAEKGKWESVCLNIRSHLSFRLMPRIGGPSGNK